MRVELRPTIAEDLPAIVGEPLPVRIQAITALIDGAVVGIGGIGFPPDCIPIAFVQTVPDVKAIPGAGVALHRAGLVAMAMIRKSKLHQVMATTDADNPVNQHWLERLGFRRARLQPIAGKVIYLWSRSLDVE